MPFPLQSNVNLAEMRVSSPDIRSSYNGTHYPSIDLRNDLERMPKRSDTGLRVRNRSVRHETMLGFSHLD